MPNHYDADVNCPVCGRYSYTDWEREGRDDDRCDSCKLKGYRTKEEYKKGNTVHPQG